MTLKELGQTLPNGFHDTEMYGVSVDFVTQKAELRFGICVGIAENHNIIFRQAKVMLTGVEYFIVQPPQYAYDPDDAPFITSDGDRPTEYDPPLPELEQEGAFRHWFSVSNWNAFIYLAATNASLEWTE